VAARLGIPDLLAEGPRDVEELAHETGSHAPSLHRVLAALASVGVLDKVGPRQFALTEVGFGLRTGVPGSARPSVLFLLNESHWRPWGHLLQTVRTGRTAFELAHGVGLFEFLAQHPVEADLFNKGMAGNSPAHARLVASSYDFSQLRMVVDVAGGRGRLLATILESNAHLRGILFDLPQVIEDARQVIGDAGVADRCAFAGGSFFEAVPEGGDAYILRNIIHDWQDDQAVAILAMRDSSSLSDTSPTIPVRHRWSITRIWRCWSTSAAWNARRTSMRRCSRAAASDLPGPFPWAARRRPWGIT
jgi:hypothetical protein